MQKRISKLLGVFFTVGVFMTLLLITASAKTVVSGDFKFDVGTKAATLVEYTGSAKTVKIPSKIKNVSVTKIGEYAFSGKSKMISVSIPSTVTVIDEGAFDACTGLTKISLPSKLKTIGDGAFWYCTGIKGVSIPGKVTKIGNNAFGYCKNLARVIIPESVKKAGDKAFGSCDEALTAFVIKGTYAEKYVKNRSDYIKLAYRYASSLTLSEDTLNLAMGETATVKATLKPSNIYKDSVKFSSSDKKIATVSSSGKITPVEPGKVVITATAADGSGKKDTVTVTVVPSGVGEITQTETGKTTATIKWTKSIGAEKHTVYKYDAGTKKWINLGNIAGDEYTAKNLPLNSTTKFRVRGYNKSTGTSYRGVFSYIYVKTLEPQNVTELNVTATDADSITLSWSASMNADGYNIYRYDGEEDKYTYIGKTGVPTYAVTGLETDTGYAFTVKSYVTDGKKTSECEKYSPKVSEKTLLGTVRGLRVDESLFSKISLSWSEVDKADGYEVLVAWGNETATVRTDETDIEVSELLPATDYTFKVRAYKTYPENYGKYSDEVMTNTMYLPADDEQAIEQFNSALAATRTYSGKLTVFEKSTQTAYDALDESPFTGIASMLASTQDNTYYVTDGKTTDGKTLSSIISDNEVIITMDDIVEDSVICKENGSGYDVSFKLKSDESGETVSGFNYLLPWQSIADANEGFELKGCTYTEMTVTAKIQDGRISYMNASMEFESDFSLEELEGCLEGENTRNLSFFYMKNDKKLLRQFFIKSLNGG